MTAQRTNAMDGNLTSLTSPANAARPTRWVVLLLVCAIFSFGSRGKTAVATPNVLAHAAAAVHFTIADFDGDHRPDFATVETGLIGASHARYWIDFRMSAGARQSIGVNAPVGGLEIASRDVNGDNVVDLIVSTAWLNQPVAILVNDGHGNFSVADPAKFSAVFANLDQNFSAPNTKIKNPPQRCCHAPTMSAQSTRALPNPASRHPHRLPSFRSTAFFLSQLVF